MHVALHLEAPPLHLFHRERHRIIALFDLRGDRLASFLRLR